VYVVEKAVQEQVFSEGSHILSHFILNVPSTLHQLSLAVLTIKSVRIVYYVILKIMCQSFLCNKVSRGVEHTPAWVSLLIKLLLLSNLQFFIYCTSYCMTIKLILVYGIKINPYFDNIGFHITTLELAVSCVLTENQFLWPMEIGTLVSTWISIPSVVNGEIKPSVFTALQMSDILASVLLRSLR
jgi:hypothetical protein